MKLINADDWKNIGCSLMECIVRYIPNEFFCDCVHYIWFVEVSNFVPVT
jgi:hypothetical protein